MIDAVVGPSIQGVRLLVVVSLLTLLGADSPPATEKPVTGPLLSPPPQSIESDKPAGDPAAVDQAVQAEPERPVPLMESLLTAPAGEEPARPLSPRTIQGESIPTSTPSAVTSEKTAATDPAAEASANELDRLIDRAIAVTKRRRLTIGEHTPWQIGHGMLAFRADYMLRKDGQWVNAFEWVATNPVFTSHTPNPKTGESTRQLPWFYLTPYGARPQPYTGRPKEFEGHPNQILAFLAMARIPLDYEFTVEGQTVTYGQMLQNAKMEVNDREEVTWTLWTFSYYYDVDERWVNAAGEPWSMERLVATTLRQFSPTRSPCGGCHALFALASARNAYLQTAGQPLTGVWMKAHMHLEEHVALAKRMQNEDGSFSSNYFKGPGQASDPNSLVSTTGHTLEFLMVALPKSRIDDPWVQDAVRLVATNLIEYQDHPLDVGGMYHAVHALILFRERTRPQFLAETPAPGSARRTATGRTPESGKRVR